MDAIYLPGVGYFVHSKEWRRLNRVKDVETVKIPLEVVTRGERDKLYVSNDDLVSSVMEGTEWDKEIDDEFSARWSATAQKLFSLGHKIDMNDGSWGTFIMNGGYLNVYSKEWRKINRALKVSTVGVSLTDVKNIRPDGSVYVDSWDIRTILKDGTKWDTEIDIEMEEALKENGHRVENGRVYGHLYSTDENTISFRKWINSNRGFLCIPLSHIVNHSAELFSVNAKISYEPIVVGKRKLKEY